MTLKQNQKVRCVNATWVNRIPQYRVVLNAVYTVEDTYYCPVCNSEQYVLHEFPYYTMMGCKCPLNSRRRQTFYSWRFEAIQDPEYQAEVTDDTRIAS